MAHSTGASIPQRLRTDGREPSNTVCVSANKTSESWVEITSNPSSSSLSSVGDEIVTTGLRVQQRSNSRQTRSTRAEFPSLIALEARHTDTSSQEEYEESESEEDRVITSSNEFQPATQSKTLNQTYSADSEDDDDENATALGGRTKPTFTPQPNAFSHPPARSAAHRAFVPRCSELAPSTKPAYPHRITSRGQYQSYNQVDHDAALRASLTTLLSIGAAAARGLPKREQSHTASNNQPMTLGLVPESELHAREPNSSRPLTPSTRARSTPSVASSELLALDSAKRKAKLSGEKTRLAKKKKVQLVEDAMVSPTLFTWVVSAGVVMLFSVVGFGAGYVYGREVGRSEGLSTLSGSGAAGCGREAVKSGSGLRRLRWSNVAKRIVA
ncbi:hypothetical protein BJ878DRAFT_424500 [Calycina marina]|uniref:Uncharacterized protein n=1 Tax=Calycina marina TaxID=1763456 RepID=A0A9P7Z191_9HELO|nr:hypothetical protein BJ878DRAFT_424500 [Calycina marina]